MQSVEGRSCEWNKVVNYLFFLYFMGSMSTISGGGLV